MSYIPTEEDYELLCQPICREYVRIEIYDSDDKLIDILNGVVTGGQSTINADSRVRRTYTCPIVPTDKQSINIAENSLLWIDKKIKIYVGLKTEKMKEPRWYPQGKYVLTDANISYNATDNTLQINCSDMMTQLDGTINGEFNGALNITIPAYETLLDSSWFDNTEASIADIYNAKHQNTILGNADVRNAVLNYYNAYIANNSVDEVDYINAIQNACNNYNYAYKIVKGNSDGKLLVLAYNTIKSVVRGLLTKYTDIKEYILEDVGEYKGTKSYDYYLQYRKEHPRWDCVPYEQEFSAGSTISSAIETFATLYSGYDFAFDENGKFVLKMIPTLYDDDVVLTYDQLKPLLIADDTESVSTDLRTIRNVCEVWGQSFESDFYTETCSTSGTTYNVTISEYGKYNSSEIISIKFNTTSVKNMSLNINGLGAILIYDEYTDRLITAGAITAGKTYSLKYKRCYTDRQVTEKFYLLGQYQVHGLAVLSNGEVIKNGYTTTVSGKSVTVDTYSKEYFKYKYNCNNVKLEIIKDSPYAVQKIGERNKTYSDDKYAQIQSDSSAVETAAYELWKNCRITDSITIKTSIIPWLSEYMKVSYKKANTDEIKQYIIRNVNHDHENHTTTIEMYTFYPLYQSEEEYELTDFTLTSSNYQMTGIESLSGDVVIPSKFLYQGIDYKVTTIADDTFSGNESITSVILPDTVTRMGKRVFKNCSNLKTVSLSKNLVRIEEDDFYRCTSLSIINIPSKLEYIGCNAFAYCSSLTSIKFGRGLRLIDSYAFSMSGLTSVDIPGNVETIGTGAFRNGKLKEITLHDGIKTINDFAFQYSNDKIVQIPSSVTTLGSNVFSTNTEIVIYNGTASTAKIGSQNVFENTNIVLDEYFFIRSGIPDYGDVIIPSTFKYSGVEFTIVGIGSYLFENNKKISYVSIPDTVKSVEEYAFTNCYNLKTVIMTDSVEEMGAYAFNGCRSLKEIRLSNNISIIENHCFNNCINLRYVNLSKKINKICDYAFSGCYNLNNVIFPNSLSYIGKYAFSSCYTLNNIELTNALTYIGEHAFSNCISLKNVYIPRSIKTINNHTFYNCIKLVSVIIENGITQIGEGAFENCLNSIELATAVIPDSVTTIGENAFKNAKIIAYNGSASGSPWGAKKHLNIIDNNVNLSLLTAEYLQYAVYPLSGDITIPSVFTSGGITYKVETLAPFALNGNTDITSVTLNIGFQDIANYAFLSCTNLKKISIPLSVAVISSSAFSGCINLEEIYVDPPNGNFYSNNGILYNKMKTKLIKYPPAKRDEEYIIPDTVTSIEEDSLTNAKFHSLTIPQGMSKISGKDLKDCINLSEIIVENGNTSLCFENNALLSYDKTVLIFSVYLSNETEYYIQDTVTEIDSYAFYKTKYKYVHLSSNLSIIGMYAFAYSSIKSIILPDSVVTLRAYAFYSCMNLENVVLPSNITYLSIGLFYNCKNLYINDINHTFIPRTVTKIRNDAFKNINSDSYIFIPSNVTSIENSAFYQFSIEMEHTSETVPSGSPWGAKSCTLS